MLRKRLSTMHKVAVLPGDGIGPEVVREAVKVLRVVSEKYDIPMEFEEFPVGGAAILKCGEPLPSNTLNACLEYKMVLFGAVGGPEWDALPGDKRPEAALLALRKTLGLYANLRPIMFFPALNGASPLREDIVGRDLDILILRELTGGIYFGRPKERIKTSDGVKAIDTMEYTENEIRRIAVKAFDAARLRRKLVTSVDKANVLENSRLWREVVEQVSQDYPDVQLKHMLVDSCAMQLISRPEAFDVILTGNMFGDILSDEAAMLTGSIGMLPSASFGDREMALYEPVHGSAPDIAGKSLANPMAAVLSSAMMLRYNFGRDDAAKKVELAVNKVLEQGYGTPDICKNPKKISKTGEIGDLICKEIKVNI